MEDTVGLSFETLDAERQNRETRSGIEHEFNSGSGLIYQMYPGLVAKHEFSVKELETPAPTQTSPFTDPSMNSEISISG